nr:type VI secretion system ATPase TssH [Actinomycetota bacterium]
MDLEKLTIKSQQALAAAQKLAADANHQQVAPAHLLGALLADPEGVVYPLLHKLGASPRSIATALQAALDRLLRVYGGAQPYLSADAQGLLDRAAEAAQSLGDAYVSTEHLLLAALDDTGDVGRALADAGID